MAKIRVGQVAKELGIKVADALALLKQLGVEAKSNLSTVDQEVVGRLRPLVGTVAGAPSSAARLAAPKAPAATGGSPAGVKARTAPPSVRPAPGVAPAARAGAAAPPTAPKPPAGAVQAPQPKIALRPGTIQAKPHQAPVAAPRPGGETPRQAPLTHSAVPAKGAPSVARPMNPHPHGVGHQPSEQRKSGVGAGNCT